MVAERGPREAVDDMPRVGLYGRRRPMPGVAFGVCRRREAFRMAERPLILPSAAVLRCASCGGREERWWVVGVVVTEEVPDSYGLDMEPAGWEADDGDSEVPLVGDEAWRVGLHAEPCPGLRVGDADIKNLAVQDVDDIVENLAAEG